MVKTDSFNISVVVPVHNEEKNILLLLERLIPVIEPFGGYEVIFVDDGSTDQTESVIESLAKINKNIKLISFTRNFGHQNALSCGYQNAKGDCVVTIDADLQDPPEIIKEMVNKWQQGAEIVYAKRKTRQDTFFKKLTAYIFYRFINFLSDTKIPTDTGDFRLHDKKVNKYLTNLPEHNKFLRGLVAWSGFKESTVSFDRSKRNAGKTNYNFSKMMNFALDGIISFSTKPLRIASYMGFFTSLLGFTGILYAIYRRFFLPHEYWVTGWTGLFVAIMFLGGTQLITIGIIGEYIGKMYKETQNRPPFLIKKSVNL
jgi:polyisoprenyl-phosphate glycosyltransferase